MDFSTIIIILIVILVCMIPFWLVIQAERNKKKKFIQHLLDAGRQHQLQLSDYETFRGKSLGIDQTNKGFVFVNQQQGQAAQIVDLKQVHAVKLGERTNKIELQFQPVQTIVFFDADLDDPTQLGLFREKAKEWISKIEAVL